MGFSEQTEAPFLKQAPTAPSVGSIDSQQPVRRVLLFFCREGDADRAENIVLGVGKPELQGATGNSGSHTTWQGSVLIPGQVLERTGIPHKMVQEERTCREPAVCTC